MSLASQGRWLSLPPLVHLEGQGCGSMGGGGFGDGIPHPLFIPSSSLSGSDPFFKLFPRLHRGEGSSWRDFNSDREGGSRASSLLSGLLQPHVCCLEGVGLVEAHHRPFPLEQVSSSNKVQDETSRLVLRAVRRGDWMVSIDLKDAHLQVPFHPESRKFLRFIAFRKVYQVKVLCFGLSTAPQVFTRVMTPVSVMLHNLGIQILRYLDN